MLKIYRAFAECGKIKLEDHIDFTQGKFNTGLFGFGNVMTNNLNCTRANYELQSLQNFRKYLQTIKYVNGNVKDFKLLNPYSYQMFENEFKDVPKNYETYNQLGLNEEGILLFTDLVRIESISESAIQKIFGKNPESGMYLITPNAYFNMIAGAVSNNNKESYGVLEGKLLGRKILLHKLNRTL